MKLTKLAVLACAAVMCFPMPSSAATAPDRLTKTTTVTSTFTSTAKKKLASKAKKTHTKTVTRKRTRIKTGHTMTDLSGNRCGYQKTVTVTKTVKSYTKGRKTYKVRKTVTKTTTTKRNRTGVLAMNGYSYLPEWLINEFYEDGNTAKSVAEIPGAKTETTVGLYSPSKGTIYIREDAVGDLSFTICHEFGHYLDRLAGNMSGTAEFAQVYNAEKGNAAVNDYSKDDVAEYFASCYALYQTYRQGLKSSCPQTYSFIEKTVLAAKAAAQVS